jgi:hypothetical protein
MIGFAVAFPGDLFHSIFISLESCWQENYFPDKPSCPLGAAPSMKKGSRDRGVEDSVRGVVEFKPLTPRILESSNPILGYYDPGNIF